MTSSHDAHYVSHLNLSFFTKTPQTLCRCTLFQSPNTPPLNNANNNDANIDEKLIRAITVTILRTSKKWIIIIIIMKLSLYVPRALARSGQVQDPVEAPRPEPMARRAQGHRDEGVCGFAVYIGP